MKSAKTAASRRPKKPAGLVGVVSPSVGSSNARSQELQITVSASPLLAKTRFSPLAKGRQSPQRIQFGSVIVETVKPTQAQAKINIDAGRSALVRAKSVLSRPGVQVRIDPGVPLYRADPATPGILIRTLNGQTKRGRMIAGRFKPV